MQGILCCVRPTITINDYYVLILSDTEIHVILLKKITLKLLSSRRAIMHMCSLSYCSSSSLRLQYVVTKTRNDLKLPKMI